MAKVTNLSKLSEQSVPQAALKLKKKKSSTTTSTQESHLQVPKPLGI